MSNIYRFANLVTSFGFTARWRGQCVQYLPMHSSFIEIPKPEKLMLQWLFMFYLKIIIPLIGKVFLGNSEDYKMLGKYWARFKNSRHFYDCLKENNLNTNYKQYFLAVLRGCKEQRSEFSIVDILQIIKKAMNVFMTF